MPKTRRNTRRSGSGQQHVDEVREDGHQREHLRREQDPLDQGAEATITPEAWASEDENQSHGRSPEKRKTAYPSIGTRR